MLRRRCHRNDTAIAFETLGFWGAFQIHDTQRRHDRRSTGDFFAGRYVMRTLARQQEALLCNRFFQRYSGQILWVRQPGRH
jgi:hypothetical protein